MSQMHARLSLSAVDVNAMDRLISRSVLEWCVCCIGPDNPAASGLAVGLRKRSGHRLWCCLPAPFMPLFLLLLHHRQQHAIGQGRTRQASAKLQLLQEPLQKSSSSSRLRTRLALVVASLSWLLLGDAR